MLFATLEFIAFFGMKIVDEENGLSVRTFPSYTPEYYDSFMYTSCFNPPLGWDHPNKLTTTRGGATDVPGTVTFASSYGDSMTYCFEVDDDQT